MGDRGTQTARERVRVREGVRETVEESDRGQRQRE